MELVLTLGVMVYQKHEMMNTSPLSEEVELLKTPFFGGVLFDNSKKTTNQNNQNDAILCSFGLSGL